MVDIALWLEKFSLALNDTFGERVWFIGLQGSYGRGEATESSDIDIVVILDKVTVNDIHAYNSMLDSLPCRELVCGFLSGKDEIFNWDTADLFQFCYDTVPVKGSLDEVMTLIDRFSVERSIKTAACNIYHGCVHNMLYEKSDEILRGLYKAASFAVQAIYFLESGKYIRLQKDLLEVVSAEEKPVVEAFILIKNGGGVSFDELSRLLVEWSAMQIKKIKSTDCK